MAGTTALILLCILVTSAHGSDVQENRLEMGLDQLSPKGTAPIRYVECVEPGVCSEKEGQPKDTQDLLTSVVSLLSKRTITKRQFSSAQKNLIVNMHNQLRSSVNPPAANMQTMSWSDKLERVAVNYANKCNFQHNSNRGKEAPSFPSVGENLYAHSSSDNVEAAIQAWYDEVQYYDYNTRSCSGVCGHYTQVVWAKSNKVGCGVKYCNPLRSVSFGSGYIVVCNYGPAGNYIGQWPYEKGQGSSPTKQPESGTPTTTDNNNNKTPTTTDNSSNNNNNNKTPTTTDNSSNNNNNNNNTPTTTDNSSSNNNKPPTSTQNKPTSSRSRKKQSRNRNRTGRRRNRNRSRSRMNRNRSRSRNRSRNKSTSSGSDWRKRLSSTCSRVRNRTNRLKSANKPVMMDWKNPSSPSGSSPTSPDSSQNQPANSPTSPDSSQPTWRRRLSSTCSRMRNRNSQLLNSMQPMISGSKAPTSSGSQPQNDWRTRMASTCSRIRNRTSQLNRSCSRYRMRFSK